MLRPKGNCNLRWWCAGAWGGGVAESLHTKKNFNYDLAIGTSTGSLLVPFVITKNFEKAKESFTGVTQKSIFNVNPFKMCQDTLHIQAPSLTHTSTKLDTYKHQAWLIPPDALSLLTWPVSCTVIKKEEATHSPRRKGCPS